MRTGYHEWQLHKAAVVALRSRDPSTKCGAVIVRPDKSVCSEGYNGFPRSMEDREEWYNNRAEKYDRVIHAEMNAILAAKESVVGYTIYGTGPTCKECAKHIIAAGITRVVWPYKLNPQQVDWADRQKDNHFRAQQLYADCGVEVLIIGEPDF